ncbi:Hypothetical predicted protein [Olea europaea subsp. europaea]|uniref:Uncharacterized protein n=1 Tax=Olea europaea subsp. europaea TaxID=158383 RepID=A0A8S0RDA9_OLEEU|nr:Hypothetical predicted protein [Olea europaea subsp. europaea]
MISPVYETAVVGLAQMLNDSMLLSIPTVQRQLALLGSPLTLLADRQKQPDGGFRPDARNSDVGTLIIQVGDTGSMVILRKDLTTWFQTNELQGQIYRRSNITRTSEIDLIPASDDVFSWTPGAPLPDIKLSVSDFFDELQYLAEADRYLWSTPIPVDSLRLQKYFDRVAASWQRNK